jgi:hypothetical protein
MRRHRRRRVVGTREVVQRRRLVMVKGDIEIKRRHQTGTTVRECTAQMVCRLWVKGGGGMRWWWWRRRRWKGITAGTAIDYTILCSGKMGVRMGSKPDEAVVDRAATAGSVLIVCKKEWVVRRLCVIHGEGAATDPNVVGFKGVGLAGMDDEDGIFCRGGILPGGGAQVSRGDGSGISVSERPREEGRRVGGDGTGLGGCVGKL